MTGQISRFVGIGSDHIKDVFTQTQGLLSRHGVDVVCLEHQVDRLGCAAEIAKSRITEELIKGATLRFDAVPTLQNGIRLEAGGLTFFEYNPVARFSYPELAAGVFYALEKNLPLYFCEWSNIFGDSFMHFESGKVCLDSINGRSTYQNYPAEFDIKERKPDINGCHITARNRYTSDAINYLFDSGLSSITHIGGAAHFLSSGVPGFIRVPEFPFDIRLAYTEGTGIPNLVKAEHKIWYDLVDEVCHEDNGNQDTIVNYSEVDALG